MVPVRDQKSGAPALLGGVAGFVQDEVAILL